MTKYWLASVAVAAMMTGSAFAQNQGLSSQTTTSTQTTTTPAAPVVDSVHATKTQNSVDSNGVETDKRQTFTSGSNGTSATANSRTTAPDGSPITSTQHERVVMPNGDTSTSSQSSTTTPAR